MSQPVFQGIDVTYKSGADNKDIRDLLEQLVPEASKQMREFSLKFKAASEKETCKKIFDYLKNQIRYVADGDQQIVKLPSALLKTKVGDCKSYSLFTASILENLKIPYKFVYASYNNNPIPGHVYVVTSQGCIIDAVYGKFNQEKPPKYKYYKDMNVRYMAGLGCDDCNSMGAVFKKKTTTPTPTTTKPKTSAVVAFAAGRGLFLGMVAANLDGIANKLQKVDTNKLKTNWTKVGGDYAKLTDAIRKGAAKPAKKLGFLAKIKAKASGRIKGLGQTDNDVKAAIIAVSAALGTAIAPGAGTAAGASVGGVLVEIYPIIVDLIAQVPANESGAGDLMRQEIVALDDQTMTADQKETGLKPAGFDIGKLAPILIVGGAIAYFALIKKK